MGAEIRRPATVWIHTTVQYSGHQCTLERTDRLVIACIEFTSCGTIRIRQASNDHAAWHLHPPDVADRVTGVVIAVGAAVVVIVVVAEESAEEDVDEEADNDTVRRRRGRIPIPVRSSPCSTTSHSRVRDAPVFESTRIRTLLRTLRRCMPSSPCTGIRSLTSVSSFMCGRWTWPR